MTSSSLLVVGSVALDDVDGPFGRHDDVLGGSASVFPSGAALFAARPAKLVAAGGDDFPEPHVSFLAGRGVDISGLERAKGKTFRWRGRYTADLSQRATLDTQLGVFAGFQPKLSAAHRGAEFVFLGNIDPSLQCDVIEQVDRPRFTACDTMNFWISGKPAELQRTLRRVDLLIVNDEEARQLAGVHNLVKAAAAIQKLGPKSVVVKRGDAGALLFHGGGLFSAPAFPVEDVRDPTGAGDTFAGGFMGYLARVGDTSAESLKRATVYGSVMASFCVEAFSLDRLRSLTREEIRARANEFSKLVHFEHVAL